MGPASSIASQVGGLKDFHNAPRVGKGVIKGAAETGSNGADRVGTLQGSLELIIREQEALLIALHSDRQERGIRL
jgi:hypothetical protein